MNVIFERLYPPKHLAQEFKQENLYYNNRAFSYFLPLVVLLLFGGSLAMGLFTSTPQVSGSIPLRSVYLINMGSALFSSAALTYIRKKKPNLMWLTNPLTIAECTMFVVLLMITTHLDIPTDGIKRIEVLMMLMFCLVFLGRYPFLITIGMQTVYSMAFIVQLYLEQNLISNFLPCLTNIIATYIICVVATSAYTITRLHNFVSRKNLESLVSIDFLTKIHNRRGFDYVLDVSWENATVAKTSLSLFVIDIDDFKLYNDRYGHPQGDECLVAVTEVISKSVRKADFVARYGGEEFAVILIDAPRRIAEQVSRRMLDEMQQRALPHESASYPFVTFSIGCMTCYPAEDSGLSREEFIRKADEALYMAKEQGKNCVVFHPESL